MEEDVNCNPICRHTRAFADEFSIHSKNSSYSKKSPKIPIKTSVSAQKTAKPKENIKRGVEEMLRKRKNQKKLFSCKANFGEVKIKTCISYTS